MLHQHVIDLSGLGYRFIQQSRSSEGIDNTVACHAMAVVKTEVREAGLKGLAMES